MSARLVTVDGNAVNAPAGEKHASDLQIFTFAIYRGQIAAAINGRNVNPGDATFELANAISALLGDAEACTTQEILHRPGAPSSVPNPGMK